MTIPQREHESAEDFTDILFWLTTRDYERRYVTDTKHASAVKVQVDQIVLGTDSNQNQQLQGGRSSTIPLKPPRLRIPHAPASYLMESLEETLRDARMVTPSSYRALSGVHPTLACQNPTDFGPIGSCRNAKPSKNKSSFWTEAAADPTASLTALRNGSTPLCDLKSIVSQRQVPSLADAYNCTLWLCNIPPSVQICEIFDTIDTGAVACLHMMPPDHNHSTSAAKLAFTTPEAAATFKRRVESTDGIWFHENRLVSRYNRQGNLRDDTSQSRCVLIEGPEKIMNVGFWYEYFQKICVFQWDRVLELPCQKPARKVMQFNFTRISGQAQACMGAIRAQEEFSGVVQLAYAADPCGNQTARIMQEQGVRVF
ncbi:hypothetical protein QTJ16_001324 [Diplocarpon rosae]|uniref:RRM domain-containing protein n=1 Tax=Diplocarpon rosae TaxID=946125 RepID=A0AAD9T833_9HELO|nr:hypothetical protein QTJ16_001324 [Diplocarpon rosae]